MTDQERKMLKSYLTECLGRRLKTAQQHVAHYRDMVEGARVVLSLKADAKVLLDGEAAAKSQHYWQGRVDEVQRAIKDFRELFEEDLKEEE